MESHGEGGDGEVKEERDSSRCCRRAADARVVLRPEGRLRARAGRRAWGGAERRTLVGAGCVAGPTVSGPSGQFGFGITISLLR